MSEESGLTWWGFSVVQLLLKSQDALCKLWFWMETVVPVFQRCVFWVNVEGLCVECHGAAGICPSVNHWLTDAEICSLIAVTAGSRLDGLRRLKASCVCEEMKSVQRSRRNISTICSSPSSQFFLRSLSKQPFFLREYYGFVLLSAQAVSDRMCS